jgi:hypothetical protein
MLGRHILGNGVFFLSMLRLVTIALPNVRHPLSRSIFLDGRTSRHTRRLRWLW